MWNFLSRAPFKLVDTQRDDAIFDRIAALADEPSGNHQRSP